MSHFALKLPYAIFFVKHWEAGGWTYGEKQEIITWVWKISLVTKLKLNVVSGFKQRRGPDDCNL